MKAHLRGLRGLPGASGGRAAAFDIYIYIYI